MTRCPLATVLLMQTCNTAFEKEMLVLTGPLPTISLRVITTKSSVLTKGELGLKKAKC